MARVILDSKSVLTFIRVGSLERILSLQFGGARLQLPVEDGLQTAQTAKLTPVTVTHYPGLIDVTVRTAWGAVELLQSLPLSCPAEITWFCLGWRR